MAVKVVKVFVLGRSGCGKSTAIRHIKTLAQRRGYDALHLKDYSILREMFLQDFDEQRFRHSEYNGFDVIDFSVLDEVLIALENLVHELEQDAENSVRPKFILLEFARKDYYRALKLFTSEFLEDAYFLFIDSGLEICIERIHNRRTQNSSEQDSHSVSDFIMRNYFNTDNWLNTMQKFSLEDHMLQHLEITNNGLLETFIDRVSNFAETIFNQKVPKNQQQQDGTVIDRNNRDNLLLQSTSASTSLIMEPVLD